MSYFHLNNSHSKQKVRTHPYHFESLTAYVFQVVMAGIIAIYGVVVAVLIAGQLAPAGAGSEYTLYK